jgi:hypothetical protein
MQLADLYAGNQWELDIYTPIHMCARMRVCESLGTTYSHVPSGSQFPPAKQDLYAAAEP